MFKSGKDLSLNCMRVISKKTLREFWERHSQSEQALKSWYHEAMMANWSGPHDVKSEYPSVSILGDNRLVFNINGNSFRLVVKINYDYQLIWIRFVGTHAAYDKVDAKTI